MAWISILKLRDKRSARMRSDSDRNMSASLTRITRQVSRRLDLKKSPEESFIEEDGSQL